MSRQPRLRPEDLDADQTTLYRAIADGPRSQGPQAFALTDADLQLQGPFGGFLLSPAIGAALAEVGVAVRYRSQLPNRLRELAILVVAASRDSAFERAAHEAVGRTCGITEAELITIRDGGLPQLDDPVELAGLRLTSALTMGDVDDEIWEQCVPPLTERDVFELIVLVGYYSTLALQMRVLRVE
ncbi:carboxymuconolactone decarboxylase family protein [Dermatophilaceae bacterium Sec6.4]